MSNLLPRNKPNNAKQTKRKNLNGGKWEEEKTGLPKKPNEGRRQTSQTKTGNAYIHKTTTIRKHKNVMGRNIENAIGEKYSMKEYQKATKWRIRTHYSTRQAADNGYAKYARKCIMWGKRNALRHAVTHQTGSSISNTLYAN